MPSGKYSDGFTKDAQKQKFVRHRDIKLKDSEIKKEAKIQKLMCEGICKRCREKVQWKFQYDKYKPLKNPATCQQCRQKTITKAYRTLCDRCATSRKVCPGCCEELVLEAESTDASKQISAGISTVFQKLPVVQEAEADENGVVWGQNVEDGEVTMDVGSDEEDEDEDEGDEEEDDEGEEDEGENLEQTPQYAMDLAWNEKKFHNIAASKYNKHRATGEAHDQHY